MSTDDHQVPSDCPPLLAQSKIEWMGDETVKPL